MGDINTPSITSNMTYCLAIKVTDGLIFASDSRTNAGVDYVTTYSKMHTFGWPGERQFVLLSAGNLATTQAVVNAVRRDLDDPKNKRHLKCFDHLFDAAEYVGEHCAKVQQKHAAMVQGNDINLEASFILGGEIKGRPPDIYLIYPQGNSIQASRETPYLQIGENKYGKPILDRVITTETSLDDAARCALVSLESTIRSNISVGPPLELLLYSSGSLEDGRCLTLDLDSPVYQSVQKHWDEGLKAAFSRLPQFDWE